MNLYSVLSQTQSTGLRAQTICESSNKLPTNVTIKYDLQSNLYNTIDVHVDFLEILQ